MVRSCAASVCLFLVAALPVEAMAQGRLEISENARFQLVRLWSEEMISWLEKGSGPEAEACRQNNSSYEAAQTCARNTIGSMVRTFALRDGPDDSATEIGILRLSATPMMGLAAAFIPTGGAVSMPLTADLAQPAYDYDFAHDVTMRGVDGEWVAISVPGRSGIGWFRKEPAAEVATGYYALNGTVVVGYPRGLELELVYELGDRSVVLLGVGTDSFVIREEQPSELCGFEGPVALRPYETEHLSWRDAYDPDGSLMLLPKYMKGC